MKKLIVLLLSLVMVLALSVCVFAANDSFDPTLNIETPEEGIIVLTVKALPDGVSATLTIPCGEDWDGARVVKAPETEGDTETEIEDVTISDGAVTFTAVGAGCYTIIKTGGNNEGGENQGGENEGNNDEVYLTVNGKMLPEGTTAGVTYDSTTNTLTLKNANLEGADKKDAGAGIFYHYKGSNDLYKTLTIKFEGTNTVTAAAGDYDREGNPAYASAIDVNGANLILEGASGAALNVVSWDSEPAYNTAVAIAVNGGTLTVNGGTINAYGGKAVSISAGIFMPEGTVTIKGGEVNAYGRTAEVNSVGIFCLGGDLIIEGGTVKAYGGEGAPASCGFAVNGECKILNDSVVVAEGKTPSEVNPMSFGIYMISKGVSIKGTPSVTVLGKNGAINTDNVVIDDEDGKYTLAVKTNADGALTTVKASEIEWANTLYFEMKQPAAPSGTTPGGYYPSVTPTTPSVDVDNGSLNDAAQAVGGAINSGSAGIEAETGYTEEDIAKLQKDGKLEMTIEKKSGYDAADKKLIDAAIAKAGGAVTGTAVQYFDITVVLKHEDTGAVVATVSDTKKPITVTVDLSADLQKAAKDGKHIAVVRCHEGKTTFLDAKLNAAKTKVTFSSDQFSTYAVVAMDKKVSAQTFDVGIALYGAMAVLAATGSVVVIGKKRK